MDYERVFRLATNSFGPEEIAILKKHLKQNKHKYLFNEWGKWYDFVDDLKALSKLFPNTLFYVAYVGENLQDNEYVLFHRGYSMPSPEHFAFKLPITEKVSELTNQLNRNRAYDENLENELEQERLNLICNFFYQQNLVDISYHFEMDLSK